MSRSWRKTGYLGDKANKWKKRQASKKARKTEIPDGRAYRRVYNPYNIRDFVYLIFNPSDAGPFDDHDIRRAFTK